MSDREDDDGLGCPECGCPDTSVYATPRKRPGYLVINGKKVGGNRRYRVCNDCGTKFISTEVASSIVRPHVKRRGEKAATPD